MIVFMPSWSSLPVDGLSSDDLMGPIKSFMHSQEAYKVLVPDYMPSLRYFLHRYDLLECDWLSLFDRLQAVEGFGQKKVSLEALNFPLESEFYYTPFNILVYQDDALIGKIYFGEGGHVSEVHFIKEDMLEKVEVYDDRGFLSSYHSYSNGEKVYTNYLDAQGESIFKHYVAGHCVVNPENRKNLEALRYESLEALKAECIAQALEEMGALDALIVSVTQENLPFLSQSSAHFRMIPSFFQERIKNIAEVKEDIEKLAAHSKKLIVDTEHRKEILDGILERKQLVETVTPYDTRFELSITQELEVEGLYIDLRQEEPSQARAIIDTLFQYILDKKESDASRKFQAIFRVSTAKAIAHFSHFVEQKLSALAPEVFPLLDKYEAISETVSLREEVGGRQFEALKKLAALGESFEFLIISRDEELEKIINQSRIVLDLSAVPDLFTQISSISAGLPQLNLKASAYVQHERNGLILKEVSELYGALEYYLEDLMHWQQARIHTISQIKKYSGYQLREKILKISRELNG